MTTPPGRKLSGVHKISGGPGGLFFFRRAPTEPVSTRVETYHDKYVIHYDFSKADEKTAIEDFHALRSDLVAAGLQTEVRAGEDASLLIFARVPEDLLRSSLYRSRVKDWLYGITAAQPAVGSRRDSLIDGVFEAENVLTVYHLIHWSKEAGGAGVNPRFGRWKNVKSMFPIHNDPANKALLKHLSKKMFLQNQDLDRIRDLFGSKVAFYFAFMQTYVNFLFFPAVTGVLAWLFLPKYSLAYAITTLFGCTVFLEYWKIQETDLGMRWNVRGVGAIKLNRLNFRHESVTVDAAGRKTHHFPRWKSVARQLLQIPFFLVALAAMGAIITAFFVIEVLISEVYQGPWDWYLEFLPTILLAVLLPYMTSALESAARWLTEYENHRTNDQYEASLTQKIFAFSFIANYMPILLTAFVYVPLGPVLGPHLERMLARIAPGIQQHLARGSAFVTDPDRLRNEVMTLTITGQISDMFQEMVLPYLTQKARKWYRALLLSCASHESPQVAPDDPSELDFLQKVRQQALLPAYNVQDDISEMVVQFGYLALFSPVWPLVSVGFLINNWIELRSDFLKICFEHQRPHPVRADGIGPWIDALDALTWLGSLTTSAIVHMFNTTTTTTALFRYLVPGSFSFSSSPSSPSSSSPSSSSSSSSWFLLPISVLVGEHVFLAIRLVVRFVLLRIGSDEIRKEREQQYAYRKNYLDNLEEQSRAQERLDVGLMERRKSVRMMDPDLFWTRQVGEGVSEEVGVRLIHVMYAKKKRD